MSGQRTHRASDDMMTDRCCEGQRATQGPLRLDASGIAPNASMPHANYSRHSHLASRRPVAQQTDVPRKRKQLHLKACIEKSDASNAFDVADCVKDVSTLM